MTTRETIIEAGAKTLHANACTTGDTPEEHWVAQEESLREFSRDQARAALDATLPLIRAALAAYIEAMGHESWDGYTPDEVPGQIAARLIEGWELT